MPFKSQAQRNYMYMKDPKLAAKFSKETPKGAKLPMHVGKGRKKPKDSQMMAMKKMMGKMKGHEMKEEKSGKEE